MGIQLLGRLKDIIFKELEAFPFLSSPEQQPCKKINLLQLTHIHTNYEKKVQAIPITV